MLANAGYKVFTFNYGNVTNNPKWPVRGTGDIRESAQELADEVDRVLAETGADKVILIGHSQGGGMTPEYYLNNLDGGAAKVSQFIGIAPGNHGADLSGLAYIQNIPVIGRPIFNLMNLLGPAWLQQAIGSPLLDEIYGNGDTRPPGVLYTTITTKDDWIVTPYTNQALDGPNVTNIILQDRYPPNFNAGHLASSSPRRPGTQCSVRWRRTRRPMRPPRRIRPSPPENDCPPISSEQWLGWRHGPFQGRTRTVPRRAAYRRTVGLCGRPPRTPHGADLVPVLPRRTAWLLTGKGSRKHTLIEPPVTSRSWSSASNRPCGMSRWTVRSTASNRVPTISWSK